MKQRKVKVITLSALAYSGSTLLGLALGRHSNITTLGEVINLEGDFSPEARCTCGERISNCTFWKKISRQQEYDIKKHSNRFFFHEKYKRHGIDKRGGFHKIPLTLGVPKTYIWSKDKINDYKEKNEHFFSTVASLSSNDIYLLDLSKPPERIDILSESDKIEVFCIGLERNLRSIYASTLKRPKKTRSKYGFKTIREAIWLFLREIHRRRTFSRIPADRRIIIDWNNFTADPNKELERVLDWLNLDKDEVSLWTRTIDTSKQHIYVGNRWLFKNHSNMIEIQNRDQTDYLTRLQRLTISIIKILLKPIS